MSDIDFLDNKKNNKENGAEADKKQPEVVWSEPEKHAKTEAGGAFAFLPFKKRRKSASTEAVLPIDNNRIKESRQEILRLIKDHENSKSLSGKSKNLLSSLGGKFKKQPGHKEVLIDYQRVFNQEKEKKNSAGQIFSATPPSPEKAGSANKPVPPLPFVFIEAWLDYFKRFLKSGKKIAPSFASVEIAPAEPTFEKPAAKVFFKAEEPTAAPKKEDIKIKSEEPKFRLDEKQYVLETNLINEEVVTFFDWRDKIIPLTGAILAPLIAVGAIYYGILFYQKSSQSKNMAQAEKFSELERTIAREEAGVKEIKAFGQKIKTVSQIFNEHIYWTNFFKFLEDNTIKKVYFTDFTGDTGGTYTLNALASSYGDIDEQVKALKSNKHVALVEASGGEMTDGGGQGDALVKFVLKFSISKDIFFEQYGN